MQRLHLCGEAAPGPSELPGKKKESNRLYREYDWSRSDESDEAYSYGASKVYKHCPVHTFKAYLGL